VRLEVYQLDGADVTAPDALLRTRFEPGSLHDWALTDSQGQPLPDGKYLFVVTARDVEAQLWFKQVTLTVQGGQVAVELTDTGESTADTAETPAMTVTAHTGGEGRLVSTRGALSFPLRNQFHRLEWRVLR